VSDDLSVVEDAGDLYYRGDLWGAFPTARQEIDRRVSGRPDGHWIDRLRQATDGRTFRRALVLNCGSGALERRLLAEGVVEAAVGIDYSDDLLDQARAAAADPALADELSYRQMDVNSLAFADEDVDLVVNQAACHHVRYLDRVLRACAELLPDDGWMVSWDYVGPHRHQWPWDQWEAAHLLNRTLPEGLRNELVYSHLPTMLAEDPTEGIHSELFRETSDRYFDVQDEQPIGGALAYLVLTRNRALLEAPADVRDPLVDEVMAADQRWLDHHPGRTLFTFLATTPKQGDTAPSADQCTHWTEEEELREEAAEHLGGEYAERTVLQDLTRELSDARLGSEHRLASIHQLQQELTDAQARIEQLEGDQAASAMPWASALRRAAKKVPGAQRAAKAVRGAARSSD
jgi:SAM-dependent methyltransferase